jgi:hypothetical protein
LSRHVYQSSRGGKLYMPMDCDGRLLSSATPRFAKMLGSKYAEMSALGVKRDLAENHGRHISSHYVQTVFDSLGDELRHRELLWEYALPDIAEDEVVCVALGRDGTTTPILKEGYKEAMSGTITLYGKDHKRLTTIYLGCAPEKNKVGFNSLFEREVELIKQKYPKTKYIGLADGAHENWRVLESITDAHILDFFHAAEYIKDFAEAYIKDEAKRRVFYEKYRTIVRDELNGAATFLAVMKQNKEEIKCEDRRKKAQQAITYFGNNVHRMAYKTYTDLGYPIGSGVTEAACKTLIKKRFSQSGMMWKKQSVDDGLLARGLIMTDGRWKQFWNRIDAEGYYSEAA